MKYFSKHIFLKNGQLTHFQHFLFDLFFYFCSLKTEAMFKHEYFKKH